MYVSTSALLLDGVAIKMDGCIDGQITSWGMGMQQYVHFFTGVSLFFSVSRDVGNGTVYRMEVTHTEFSNVGRPVPPRVV